MTAQRLSIAVFAFLFFPLCISAQSDPQKSENNSVNATEPTKIPIEKKISVNALIVGDYGVSLTDNVDINGKHNADGVKSQNGFYLKYARVQAKMDITQNISGQVLANFADFKDNPQTKVLEIATIKYKVNNYINFQVGQFRPYFGKEDLYAIDVNRSYNWSRQYSLMGSNQWQSFQLGAAFFGSLEDKKIPLKYFYSITNGNGKNQKEDNDNYKNHSFRVEYTPFKNFIIGANTAFGKANGEDTSAYGIDLSYERKINPFWTVGVDTEFKQASNIVSYNASKDANKQMKDYRAQGFYITPLVHYNVGNHKIFDAIEFSFRYEYLEDLMKNGNPSRSYVPMLGFVIGDNFQSRICLVGNFTNYNKQVPNTTYWNNNQFFVQYQFRY